jgi:hypothetical protein
MGKNDISWGLAGNTGMLPLVNKAEEPTYLSTSIGY